MGYQHASLAAGGWSKLSLMEQLGNIGSEVGRAAKWQNKDQKIFEKTTDRALELFDLTLDDPRWRGRTYEIARAREVFCDTIMSGKKYRDTLESLDKYFGNFALAARLNK